MTNYPDALATPYQSAPGHTPSLSAYCHANGIVFGSHPYNGHQANFQIWHEGHILVNTTTGPEQHWTFPVGDYTIKYAGKSYEVRQDRCDDTQSTTTQPPSTTTTSEQPTATTETTATPTTLPATTTTLAPEVATTTTSDQPSSTTTTDSPVTTQPPVVITWYTTPDMSLSSVQLIPTATVSIPTTDPLSSLPHTGAAIDPTAVAFTGLALAMIGFGLKRKFGIRKV